jgi:hypothetical protein
VLKVRLTTAADKSVTLAEDTASFCAFPNAIRFPNDIRNVEPDQLPLHIPTAAVLDAVDKTRYAHLVHDTHIGDDPATFRADFRQPAGTEPYNLLAHLAQQLHGKLIVDLGTHYASSAFALGSEPSNTIWSYDLFSHEQLIADYNNISTAQLKQAAPNIEFKGGNALLALGLLLPAPLISLDTAHFPDTIPFEREFVLALQQAGYRGVVICDDIFLNREMVDWWGEIRLPKYDITHTGHAAGGTGVIDFSGMLIVEDSLVAPADPSGTGRRMVGASHSMLVSVDTGHIVAERMVGETTEGGGVSALLQLLRKAQGALEEYSRKEAAEARRLQVEQTGLLDQLAQKNALIAALRQQAANSRQCVGASCAGAGVTPVNDGTPSASPCISSAWRLACVVLDAGS